MPKIHLITFADGSLEYHAAGKRLIKQSLLFPQINIRKVFSSFDLGAEYHDLFKPEITSAKVGFGFYSWKPYIVNSYLHQMLDGDIMIYIDCGCELNPAGQIRFDDYLSMTCEHGSLLFEQHHPLRYWTKQHPGLNIDLFGHRNTLVAGVFFLQKNSKTIAFSQKWLDISSIDGGNVLSDPDKEEVQQSYFKAHRHDLSTFSLAGFQSDVYSIACETFFENWEYAKKFPILAFRNRTGSELLNQKLKKRNVFKRLGF